MSVQEHLEALISAGLGDEQDVREDERRWAEFERTGETVPADVAFAKFLADLKTRFSERNT